MPKSLSNKAPAFTFVCLDIPDLITRIQKRWCQWLELAPHCFRFSILSVAQSKTEKTKVKNLNAHMSDSLLLLLQKNSFTSSSVLVELIFYLTTLCFALLYTHMSYWKQFQSMQTLAHAVISLFSPDSWVQLFYYCRREEVLLTCGPNCSSTFCVWCIYLKEKHTNLEKCILCYL